MTPQTQAILLLTSYFSKPSKAAPKPLSATEWGRFASWLKGRSLSPGHLLNGSMTDSLGEWADKTVTLERIEGLLNRGSALALAMEKWTRVGLGVVTRSDLDYPARLKRQLGQAAPPVLFCSAGRSLLNAGGVAVVGSRNATEQDLAWTRRLGERVAHHGLTVVSGGARGVDEAAMLGALDAEGTVIGVLSDGLMRASTSQKYRRYLRDGNLLLVSPFYPEAGFSAGNAMARNKYIYCLSDSAVVIHSARKGGTWSGATESLRKHRVPVWVKPTGDPDAGNSKLVEMGANWLPKEANDCDVDVLIGSKPSAVEANVDAKGEHSEGQTARPCSSAPVDPDATHRAEAVARVATPKDGQDSTVSAKAESVAPAPIDFYDLFLQRSEALCCNEGKNIDELAECLGLKKVQVSEWVKRAVSEGTLERLRKPVRYRWSGTLSKQISIFSN